LAEQHPYPAFQIGLTQKCEFTANRKPVFPPSLIHQITEFRQMAVLVSDSGWPTPAPPHSPYISCHLTLELCSPAHDRPGNRAGDWYRKDNTSCVYRYPVLPNVCIASVRVPSLTNFASTNQKSPLKLVGHKMNC